MGHGEKSLDLALELGVPVTREEKLAIRWHMAPYENQEMGLKFYSGAIKESNLAFLLHTADMLESLFGIDYDLIEKTGYTLDFYS